MLRTVARSFALALFVILSLAACQQRQESVKESGPREGGKAKVAKPIPSSFNRVLAGSIDGKYRIQMELTRNGEKLTGSYFYEKVRETTGGAKYIGLEGTIDKEGNFSLEEFDSEKKSGTFKGRVSNTSPDDEPLLQLAGTWSKASDNKELTFSAAERRFDLGNLKIKSKEQKEENKKLKYKVEVLVPQLEGAGGARVESFNREAEARVKKESDAFKEEFKAAEKEQKKSAEEKGAASEELGSYIDIGYEVTAASPSLISVLFGVSDYYQGAAHPNHYSFVLNYDLSQGKVLALSDLFKPDSGYLKFISDHSVKSLKKRGVGGEGFIDGASAKPENYKSWNLLPNGLLITFDPYQVASYAEGPQEVFIPYSALKEILSPDVPVASLAK